MRKNVKVLLSLVMAAAMLAGCGGQSSEKPAENGASGQTTQASAGKEDGAGSEGGKVMTYAMQKEPETLDPTMNNYATSSIVLQNLFTGLMQIGPDGGLINGCAEKYEVSGDGLEYTFTLRDGLKWSDGSPLTAGDFEYAWKRTLAQDTASPGAWYLFYLKNGEDTEGHFGEPHRLLYRPYSCHRLFPGEEGCGGRAGGLDQVSGHLCKQRSIPAEGNQSPGQLCAGEESGIH